MTVQFFAFNKIIADELKSRITPERLANPLLKADGTFWKPSKYQYAIFDWTEHGRGSALVKAVAGSGKTTTCVATLSYMKGVKCKDIRASTFHSVGFGAIMKKLGKRADDIVVKGDKLRRLARDILGDVDHAMYGTFCAKLVSFAKGRGIGPLVPDTVDQWYDIIQHHDLYLDHEDAEEGRAIEIAQDLLRRSNELGLRGNIDFDDQLYLPLLWKCQLWQNDWVIVDEAQDTNPVRRAIAKLALRPGGRLMAVGDECQPANTKITMASGCEIQIEKLKIGDMVRSFCRRDASFVQSGRRVNGITRRYYSGSMVTINSNGKSSSYTNNHYCYALWKPLCDNYTVYVMRKGDCWRIGTSKLQHHGKVFGPMVRKRIERADDVWVLATFPTEREAKIYEFKVSTEFGVPELLFRAPGHTENQYWQATQDALDDSWSSLDKDRLEKAAYTVLLDHGREPKYPLNELASKPGEFWITRPSRVRACNLVKGMQVLHYSGLAHYSRDNYYLIDNIESKLFEGDVWSLDIDRDHTYIADGIATFNCQSIYGFVGASADAMDLIKREFNCIELPLTVSYRCPKAVAQRVQALVPYFEVPETAPEGEVKQLDLEEAIPLLGPQDAVLCRQTAPLISLAFNLIGRGIGCHVLGKEIGVQLVDLIKKQRATDIESLGARLEKYLEREVSKYAAKGEEDKAEAVSDRVASIFAVIEGLDEDKRSIAFLISKLESLFSDDSGVLTLATVHKVKGKEYRRVAILKPELMPSKWARQEHQFQQELNIQYVAWSRAQEMLIELVEG